MEKEKPAWLPLIPRVNTDNVLWLAPKLERPQGVNETRRRVMLAPCYLLTEVLSTSES